MKLATNEFPVWRFCLMVAVWVCHNSCVLAAEFGFSGMHVQGINLSIAKALGMSKPRGVLVRDVALGGPANKAGIQRGDLILYFDNTDIQDFMILVEAVSMTRPGEEVLIILKRLGIEKNVKLKLGRKPASWKVVKGSVTAIKEAGITLAAVTEEIRKRFNIRWGSPGVLVTLVDPNFDKNKHLQRGDVIVQINQQPVWLPAQIRVAYDEAKKGGLRHLLMLVERASGFEFMTLPVK